MHRQNRFGRHDERRHGRDFSRQNKQRGDWKNYEDQDLGGYTGLGSSRSADEDRGHFGGEYGMSHRAPLYRPIYGPSHGDRTAGAQHWQDRDWGISQDWSRGHRGYGTTGYGRTGYPEEEQDRHQRRKDRKGEGSSWEGQYERWGEGYGLRNLPHGQNYSGDQDQEYRDDRGRNQEKDWDRDYRSKDREEDDSTRGDQERNTWGRGYDPENEEPGREDWNLGNYGQRRESERSHYRFRRGGYNPDARNYSW